MGDTDKAHVELSLQHSRQGLEVSVGASQGESTFMCKNTFECAYGVCKPESAKLSLESASLCDEDSINVSLMTRNSRYTTGGLGLCSTGPFSSWACCNNDICSQKRADSEVAILGSEHTSAFDEIIECEIAERLQWWGRFIFWLLKIILR